MNNPLRALTWTTLVVLVAPRMVAGQTPEPPRLVALVVVDQFPEPLFESYDSIFSGGFRRLLDNGMRFTQASHAYAQTHTASGHATLGSGVVPARHGVVANAWREQVDQVWKPVLAVADSTVRIVGVPWAEGRSPAGEQVTGLADWLLDAGVGAKVLSVAEKDRSAIGMAAKARTDVYWLNAYEKRFVTSTYYRDKSPTWLDDFNRDQLPAFFVDSVWVSRVPEARAHLSRRDTVDYEGDGIHTYFPHQFLAEAALEEDGAFQGWIASTPPMDAATLALALAGVEALELGRDDVPDFLAVSLAQTDLIGHPYGPHSREQLDNLLRLDTELGRFFQGLDELVGEGRWAVVLTSDHGALPMPEYLQEQGIESRRTTVDELQAMIIAARKAQADGPPESSPDRVAARLAEFPLAVQVFTGHELLHPEPADSFAVLYSRSYFPGRAVGYFGDMDVLVRFPERVIPTTFTRGTDHRSGYWYDRHVPMVYMGPGIHSGTSAEPARAVDVAPTLFHLMGFTPPEGLDGRVILP